MDREFIIDLSDQAGGLVSVMTALLLNNNKPVDLQSFFATGLDGGGVLHFIPKDPVFAESVLSTASIAFDDSEDIIRLFYDNEPGELADTTNVLNQKGVNIKSIYLLSTNRTRCKVVISVDAGQLASTNDDSVRIAEMERIEKEQEYVTHLMNDKYPALWQEFTIYLSDKPGELNKIAQRIYREHINIHSIAATTVGGRGTVKLITAERSAPSKATAVLDDMAIPYVLRPTTEIALNNKTEDLIGTLERLSNINLEAVYFIPDEEHETIAAITVDKFSKAREALATLV